MNKFTSTQDMSEEEKLDYMMLFAERLKDAAQTKIALINRLNDDKQLLNYEYKGTLIKMVLRDIEAWDLAHAALYA
jgi:hypothetical protein